MRKSNKEITVTIEDNKDKKIFTFSGADIDKMSKCLTMLRESIKCECACDCANYEKKIEKKKLRISELSVGDVFNYAGNKWIKLDTAYNGSLVLSYDVIFDAPFDEDSNDWMRSSLRERLHRPDDANVYIPRADLIRFERDLTTDDGMTDYGTCNDYVSLLTCDEYRKYRKLIPECRDVYWTITANNLINQYSVRYVHSDGSLGFNNTYNGNIGVRPLCVLKADVLVEPDKDIANEHSFEINKEKTDLLKEFVGRLKAKYKEKLDKQAETYQYFYEDGFSIQDCEYHRGKLNEIDDLAYELDQDLEKFLKEIK